MTEVVGVGYDGGFGRGKAVGPGGDELVVPAAVQKVSSELMGRETITSYSDNTGRYLVGDDAIRFGEPARTVIDSSYIETNEFRVMTMYLLQQLGGSKVRLVTGLPVQFYRRDRDRLKQIIQGWTTPRKIEIVDVKVYPQPFGSMMDLSWDWHGTVLKDFSQARTALVDIGHGTTDAIEIAYGQPSPNNYGGTPEGISRIHDKLYNHIRRRFELPVNRADMDSVVRNGGINVQGEKKDLSKFIRSAKREAAEAVESLVLDVWGSTKGLDKIVITGGGAEALRHELTQIFPKAQLEIPEYPGVANARGFAKIANLQE